MGTGVSSVAIHFRPQGRSDGSKVKPVLDLSASANSSLQNAGPRSPGLMSSAGNSSFSLGKGTNIPSQRQPDTLPLCFPIHLLRISAGFQLGGLQGWEDVDGDVQFFPRLPVLRLPRPWDRLEDPVSPAPASDKGFHNPMFNVVSQHCQGHQDAQGVGRSCWAQPWHS